MLCYCVVVVVVVVVVIVVFIGYTGTTCDEDFDACAALQCYPEVACVDLPPPSQLAECATCPSGTVGDGRVCEDFNECVGDRGNVHNCSDVEICSNLIGSYECSCIAGYERNTAGMSLFIEWNYSVPIGTN